MDLFVSVMAPYPPVRSAASLRPVSSLRREKVGEIETGDVPGVAGSLFTAQLMDQIDDQSREGEQFSNYNQENCPSEGDGIV